MGQLWSSLRAALVVARSDCELCEVHLGRISGDPSRISGALFRPRGSRTESWPAAAPDTKAVLALDKSTDEIGESVHESRMMIINFLSGKVGFSFGGGLLKGGIVSLPSSTAEACDSEPEVVNIYRTTKEGALERRASIGKVTSLAILLKHPIRHAFGLFPWI